MKKVKQDFDPTKSTWIYWRHNGGAKTFSKSFVQNFIDTTEGRLLELCDNDSFTMYPTRILRKEIYILKVTME